MSKNLADQNEKENYIETSLTIVKVRKDGIAEIKFKKDEYEVSVQDQFEIEKAILRLTNNGETALHIIVKPGRYGSITKEAREMEMFLSLAFKNQKSIAIISNSLAQRIIGTAYFSFKKEKPNYPFKFFKTEEEAILWQKELNKTI